MEEKFHTSDLKWPIVLVHRMASDGIGWHRMASDGIGWHRMAPDGTGWHRMAPDGTGWHRMAPDGTGCSDDRVVRMWVWILAATVVLVSLSKTLNCHRFSSPRSINGDLWRQRWLLCLIKLVSLHIWQHGLHTPQGSWDGSRNDVTDPMTGVIMFMCHERQTWRILAEYKCPLLYWTAKETSWF